MGLGELIELVGTIRKAYVETPAEFEKIKAPLREALYAAGKELSNFFKEEG